VLNPVRCLVFAVAVGCTSIPKPGVPTNSDVSPSNCPKLTDRPVVEAGGRTAQPLPADSLPRAVFMSFVIDGQRATINVPKFQFSEAPLFYPSVDPADIVSITPLSPSEAARWYKPCPGVEVIMIRTKSGNWRPSYPSRR
jgi:hypothetical protein